MRIEGLVSPLSFATSVLGGNTLFLEALSCWDKGTKGTAGACPSLRGAASSPGWGLGPTQTLAGRFSAPCSQWAESLLFQHEYKGRVGLAARRKGTKKQMSAAGRGDGAVSGKRVFKERKGKCLTSIGMNPSFPVSFQEHADPKSFSRAFCFMKMKTGR